MHVDLKSQKQAAETFHTSHQLVAQVPSTVCHHQRAPPAPFATAHTAAVELCSRKHQQERLQIPAPPPTHCETLGLEGLREPCQASPVRSREPIPTMCSTQGAAERGYAFCSLQNKPPPLTRLGCWALPAFQALLPPTTGCYKTSQGASIQMWPQLWARSKVWLSQERGSEGLSKPTTTPEGSMGWLSPSRGAGHPLKKKTRQ